MPFVSAEVEDAIVETFTRICGATSSEAVSVKVSDKFGGASIDLKGSSQTDKMKSSYSLVIEQIASGSKNEFHLSGGYSISGVEGGQGERSNEIDQTYKGAPEELPAFMRKIFATAQVKENKQQGNIIDRLKGLF